MRDEIYHNVILHIFSNRSPINGGVEYDCKHQNEALMRIHWFIQMRVFVF